ncbi:MAG: NUDIX hydrolase [Hyphomicrobium sp.]|uniref:NUDIX hydrolase n=1 Tax=Hyphomicrobium sp. TaxID=82 RepID=UPI0039E3335D
MAKSLKSSSKKHRRGQVAALPLRITDDGEVNVLLVSSRETKRWIIPKGWTNKNLSDPKAAAAEARQEAGVTGKIGRKPVGYFSYKKVLPASSRVIDVAVYVLWVKKQLKQWREQTERTRIWTTFEDAEKLVREPGLKKLFADLALETGASLEERASKASNK